MSLSAAMKAQAMGLSIFPVKAGDKVPHPAAGYRDAAGGYHGWGEVHTTDLPTIASFWSSVDPAANVGVACKPSQLLVVDLDIAKSDNQLVGTEWAYMHSVYGPRVNGTEVWDEMQYKLAEESSPETYTVRTGSGGIHLYFWWPTSWPKASQASPVKGIVDVRGNGGQWGGYVLGEGSRTASGVYEAVCDAPIALTPVWLRHLVVEKPAQPKIRRPAGLRQPGAISWSGLVDSVRNAGEGNRNNALLWASRAMYSDGATEVEAYDTLGPAAADAGLSDFEIRRTIESGYRAQRQKEG